MAVTTNASAHHVTGYVSAGTHWLLATRPRPCSHFFPSCLARKEPMLVCTFHPYAPCNAHPGPRGGPLSVLADDVTPSYDACPAGPGTPYTSRGGFSHSSRASNIRSVTRHQRGREEEGRRGIWWGEWMCVLILSQRIERNKPRRDSRQRGGLGRTSSAISKTIEFPAISKATSRPFIHPSIHAIQVPAPTTNTSPRDHVQNSSVRPRPPIPSVVPPSLPLPRSPTPSASHPRHPRPGDPTQVGEEVGGGGRGDPE